MPRACVAVIALALAAPSSTHAGPIVDRIKASGVIRCGGVPRPGLSGRSADGSGAGGLYLDLCRAIGAAVLDENGKFEFHPYGSEKSFERVGDGADDLSFLDGSDIADHRLAARISLGPAVYFVSTAAMVHGDSDVRTLSDLAGKSICFYQGSTAQMDLEGFMAGRGLNFARMAYTEHGELDDAYDARICGAVVGEAGALAAARLNESAETPSRILAEPFATFPVFVATPASDPQWTAIVAWAIFALQRAELAASPWAASGVDSLAVRRPDLGLAGEWVKRVVGAAGTYADIYARNLGDRSPLKLPRGANAPAERGGLFVTQVRK